MLCLWGDFESWSGFDCNGAKVPPSLLLLRTLRHRSRRSSIPHLRRIRECCTIWFYIWWFLSWRCCHDPWKRRHPFSTRSTANRATQNTRQHSASAVTRESSARGRQRRASSPVRFVRICEIAVKVFKIAFFCTCLKTVWIAFPKCQFDRHFFSGQELPRAVLHLCRLQRVFEWPVCLRCHQWWDCLLWMWHQEERLEMWLMVKLWGTPFITNTKWKLSWVSCC